MRSHEDQQFEAYLKRFAPLIPDPLPGHERRYLHQPWPALGLCIPIVAALLIVGAILLWIGRPRFPLTTMNGVPAKQLELSQPLTMRSANALLAAAPSLKELLDEIAFARPVVPLESGQQSAFAVLGKEKIKL